jgi:hypothetical protein
MSKIENDKECVIDKYCASGYCDTKGLQLTGKCKQMPPKIENGKECTSDQYCASGYCHMGFFTGKCEQQKEIGTKCFRDAQCISNLCTNNGKLLSLPKCQIKP